MVEITPSMDAVKIGLRHQFAGDDIDLRQLIDSNNYFIQTLDKTGEIWESGLFAELSNRVHSDPRYSFMSRMARSAYFGELLASSYSESKFGRCPEKVIQNARLINLFVTAFDSICDEIPEQLPETLRLLRPIFQLFPQEYELKIEGGRTLSKLTVSLASAIASEIGASIRCLPKDSQDLLSRPVISAFEDQLSELSINTVEAKDVMNVIDKKSIGPFKVILSLPHLFSGNLNEFNSVHPISESMGSFFGWIDDLVDYEQDLNSGKKTSVHSFIQKQGTKKDINSLLLLETKRRYELMLECLEKHQLKAMKCDIQKAIALWI